MLTPEEKEKRKEDRKKARYAAKQAEQEELERNQPPVKSITITIEWKKSRMWGSNPHATADVTYQSGGNLLYNNGGFKRQDGFTASGCGYDKESTVIAEVFNTFLKYKLYAFDQSHFEKGENALPYGIVRYDDNNPHYSGGIGTSCYYKIAEAIGGTFERIASGKTFDVYKYTDKPNA